jgi:hypothetical protein
MPVYAIEHSGATSPISTEQKPRGTVGVVRDRRRMSTTTRITLLERLPDLAPADFDAHWSGPHVPIVLGLPGIRSYVQHHLIADDTAICNGLGVDGIVEIGFDADPGMTSSRHRSAAQEADELEFLSGLTGFVSTSPRVTAALFGVWIVGGVDVALPVVTDRGLAPIEHRRDVDAEPSIRHRLRHAEPLPDGALAIACDRAADALALRDELRHALSDACIVATRAVAIA